MLSWRLAPVDPNLWDLGCSEECRPEVRHMFSPLSGSSSHLNCHVTSQYYTASLPCFWVTGSWCLANAAFSSVWDTHSRQAGPPPPCTWPTSLPARMCPSVLHSVWLPYLLFLDVPLSLLVASHPASLSTGISPVFSHRAQSLLEHEPSLLTGPW